MADTMESNATQNGAIDEQATQMNKDVAEEPTTNNAEIVANNLPALSLATSDTITSSLDQVTLDEQEVGITEMGVSEVDNNLIDIINSMESDRQKFIAHVRTKISTQETEFQVSAL